MKAQIEESAAKGRVLCSGCKVDITDFQTLNADGSVRKNCQCVLFKPNSEDSLVAQRIQRYDVSKIS